MDNQTVSIPQALQLALQHHQANRLQEAEQIYRQVLEVEPNNSDALHLLGVIAYQVKNYDVAVDLISQAIQINDTAPNFYNSLGNALSDQGKLEEALACYRQVLALVPNFAEAYRNLGVVFKNQGLLDEALEHYQRAIHLEPNLVDAHISLGVVFLEQGLLTKAIESCERAFALNPDAVEPQNNLANALKEGGRIEEAIEHYRAILKNHPIAQVHSNLLTTLNYAVGYEAISFFSEHQQFNEQYALPVAAQAFSQQSHSVAHGGRLKIGYVSPDLRYHPVAYFIEPILAHHDHEQFEIFCYYTYPQIDKVTRHLQQYVDHWFDCAALSNGKLADKISLDQIDILVDLTGHTAKNRLLMLAMKPAPVQVTYLGYPCTTGLTMIDYRITDGYMDPVDRLESLNSETPVRMQGSYFCYSPHENSPPVSELPAIEQGYVTFGSFNNYCKLNAELFALWAQILGAVPDSKLLIKAKSLADQATREALLAQFAQLGIAADRLIVSEYTQSPQHLKSYHQVDIALDSFPFTGGTTTFEALWMGVPVVTLVGERQVSRQGLSILSVLRLTDLIADTPEAYVDRAVKLARDIQALQQLRGGMRAKMQTSPLMDGVSFTRDLEARYREMWENKKHQH